MEVKDGDSVEFEDGFIPDSEREDIGDFRVGDDVRALWSDGIYYGASILAVGGTMWLFWLY